jgi:hypothetical protein
MATATRNKGTATTEQTAKALNVPVPEKAEKPTFGWDDLPDVKVPEYTRNVGTTRIDVETEIPAVIRARLKESFEAYRAADPNKPNDHGTTAWREQDCGTPERAAEFIRLAQRYGKYRLPEPWTIRAAVVPNNERLVRFAAKPYEARMRKS